ncbi:hypothetical protein [Amycolatopsis sacchari]|uniref:hypothetical protein n=1 Tax=Amycolatopsis sacchari TaxID=115433 RepID=UPI003D761E41
MSIADPWQARLDRMRRIVPLPLLAVSTAASFAVPGPSRFALEAVFAGAAAVWSAVVSARPAVTAPRWQRLVAYAVHTTLAAVLVGINLCFGIFAYSGFLFAYPLGRRWRVAGFAATALIVSASLSGATPPRSTGTASPTSSSPR